MQRKMKVTCPGCKGEGRVHTRLFVTADGEDHVLEAPITDETREDELNLWGCSQCGGSGNIWSKILH